MLVLGIDPSIRETGIVLLDTKVNKIVDSWYLPFMPQGEIDELWSAQMIFRVLKPVIDHYWERADFHIGIEVPCYRKSAGVFGKHSAMVGSLRTLFMVSFHGIHYKIHTVTPTQTKAAVDGILPSERKSNLIPKSARVNREGKRLVRDQVAKRYPGFIEESWTYAKQYALADATAVAVATALLL